MALRRWRESVSSRHGRRHGAEKARFIRQINWVHPQWPIAGWAGLMMAGLALFLFVAFALYLPWYALLAYAALVATNIVLMAVHWPRWILHSLRLAAFSGIIVLLLRITPLYPSFVLALVLGAGLSLWLSRAREKDTEERDAFKRERTSP